MVAPCLIFITSSRDGAQVRLEGPLRVTTPSLFSLARRTCILAGKVSFILRDGGNGSGLDPYWGVSQPRSASKALVGWCFK